jgi:hypothetical protein
VVTAFVSHSLIVIIVLHSCCDHCICYLSHTLSLYLVLFIFLQVAEPDDEADEHAEGRAVEHSKERASSSVLAGRAAYEVLSCLLTDPAQVWL